MKRANPPSSLCVAIPTYQRPRDLATLLPLVLRQVEQTANLGLVSSCVLVVDNDPARSADAVVRALGNDLVRYVSEPEPGVVAVRNRALAEVGSDLLIFIDDDERPRQGWLEELVKTQRATGAAAVRGRVESVFDPPLDEWLAAGGFWNRLRWPTATPLSVTNTGNLLLDLRQIRMLGLQFSRRFGLSGGEDSDFSRSLVDRGGVIVACDESVAVDVVRTDRMNRGWILRRSFSHGNTASLVDIHHVRGRRTIARLRWLALGVGRIAAGGGRAALGATIRSPRHHARGLRLVARGCGMVVGGLGWVYEEYAREGPHLRRW